MEGWTNSSPFSQISKRSLQFSLTQQQCNSTTLVANTLDNNTKKMAKNPLFNSTSSEKPKLLTISFKDDPQGSLGAQLINCDKVSHWHSNFMAFVQSLE